MAETMEKLDLLGPRARTELQAVENVAVNDEQIEELRRWATFLSADERPEVRAAAKAILLLVDDLAAAKSQLAEERLMLVAEKIALSRRRALAPLHRQGELTDKP